MCQYLLFGWAATVVVAVFVLYVRDPFARGIHASRVEPMMEKLKDKLLSFHEQWCMRGWLPCPSQ